MNATMVASGTKAAPPVVSSIQDIPLAKIRESKTNHRFEGWQIASIRKRTTALDSTHCRSEASVL